MQRTVTPSLPLPWLIISTTKRRKGMSWSTAIKTILRWRLIWNMRWTSSAEKNTSETKPLVMFIPGILITFITFPGVIVHALAHQLFCRLYKVPVFQVVYFRMGNPAGYVLHEVPQSKLQSIMISIGPFLVNTLTGALVALPAAMPVFKFDNAGPLDYVLIYLGVS